MTNSVFLIKFVKLISFIFILLIPFGIHAQSQINGKITAASSAEELIGATVKIKGTSIGGITDINGEFKILTSQKVPITLEISYVGYGNKEVVVNSFSDKIKVALKNTSQELEAVEVVSRISEKAKESPLTVETMTINGIKETPATNFYEGLSHLKGVDLTSASLGFRVVNTRGFNSTSPVRSLQIIDGIDNASPGLNFCIR